MPDKFWTERDHEDRARVRDEQLDIERHYDRLISQAEGDPALQEFCAWASASIGRTSSGA